MYSKIGYVIVLIMHRFVIGLYKFKISSIYDSRFKNSKNFNYTYWMLFWCEV